MVLGVYIIYTFTSLLIINPMGLTQIWKVISNRYDADFCRWAKSSA
jgi:hypothetical protein